MKNLCRSCKAPIVWILTPSGKKAPADTALSYTGQGWREVDGQWKLVEASAEAPVHLSHFTTCPDGPAWSSKKPTKAKKTLPEPDASTLALFGEGQGKACDLDDLSSPASLSVSRAIHNQDGDRIRIQVRVKGQILDFDVTLENFALAVTGLAEVPITLERWRGRPK